MPILIGVGTTNKAKVDAVREVLARYEMFKEAAILPVEVESGVSDQPKSLEETFRGAKNRAEAAFFGCAYSIGIESGLIDLEGSHTGHLDLCVCVIYDGRNFGTATSGGFECPPAILALVEQGKDLNQASYELGLTKNLKVGSAEGLIGILSQGMITRKSYTQEAVEKALIPFQNRKFYF